MRRDYGNEVVVAVIAVALIAFALIFGVVLSLSNPEPAGTVLLPTATGSGAESTQSVIGGAETPAASPEAATMESTADATTEVAAVATMTAAAPTAVPATLAITEVPPTATAAET
ncbi:MAG TPA: hypothetical protein VER79_00795, partial [Candidatus Limnocylindrales bacterium]|nr:hypothetical protein [Candidatus Limnocylindrales bacterium]